MTESNLYAEILREHSHGGTRLLRVNAGMAYQGRVIERTSQRLILAPWYPVKLATEGVSDLIGWTNFDLEWAPIIRATAGLPSQLAIFTAIEAKTGNRKPTPAQAAFLNLVRRSGGRAGIARSVEEASAIIRGPLDYPVV